MNSHKSHEDILLIILYDMTDKDVEGSAKAAAEKAHKLNLPNEMNSEPRVTITKPGRLSEL